MLNNDTSQSRVAVECTHRIDFFAQMGAAHVLNIAHNFQHIG